MESQSAVVAARVAGIGDPPSPHSSSLTLRIKELEEQHLKFRNSLICAFNQLLDLKDISTGVHSTRLAEWAIRVARKLNIPEEHMYQVEVAALLHDIGKVGVPDSILKKQGPLTAEELEPLWEARFGRCALAPFDDDQLRSLASGWLPGLGPAHLLRQEHVRRGTDVCESHAGLLQRKGECP